MRDRFQKAAFALTLLSGFLAGSALPEFLRMGTGAYAGFMSLYSLQRYGRGSAPMVRVLPYVVSGRFRTLLFLWMSSYTAAGLLFHLVYAWWLAASAGMLLALFLLRGGYTGVLLFFCCLFPQWLLYGTMWQREIRFLVRQRSRSGFGERTAAGRRSDLLVLTGMAGFCLLGCAAEVFLGTWTQQIFLRFFSGSI